MTKNLYRAWAQNASGASTDVSNFGSMFTSQREAENEARRQFGSGWTIHIEKVWQDGDGQSWNSEYNQEVKTFRIR